MNQLEAQLTDAHRAKAAESNKVAMLEELLKAATPGSEVVVSRKERTVTVNSAVAFKQEKEDSKESFRGSFTHLTLPA